MSEIFENLDQVSLAYNYQRVSALLCAVLSQLGGSVILSKEESEKTWEGASLAFDQLPGGPIKISLKGTPH